MSEQSDMAVFEYRLGRVEKLQEEQQKWIADHDHQIDEVRSDQATIHEQIAGEGGLYNVIRSLREEVSDVRRAFYTLTGTIIIAIVALTTAIATHAV